jgi:hypothetical protein
MSPHCLCDGYVVVVVPVVVHGRPERPDQVT